MHDLKANFDKILLITNHALMDKLDTDGNLQHYPRKPKLSDNGIIALSLCQECLSIDSENCFWQSLKVIMSKERRTLAWTCPCRIYQ